MMKSAFLLFSISLVTFVSVFGQKPPVELRWDCQKLSGTENEYECLLVAEHFDDILSLQFSVRWDKSKTDFVSFAPIDLPKLNQDNVNTQTAPQGFIRFLWVDLSLSGVTLVPGTPLFSFQVKSKGQPELKLASTPLSIEIIDTDEISRQLKWE